MRLCVNIGNTSTQFGLFDGMRLLAFDRMPTEAVGRDPLPPAVRGAAVESAVVGSVAPSRTRPVCRALEAALRVQPRVAGQDVPVPIEVRVRFPERVGVDRLLNALAAHRRVRAQTIVVDAGTAVTVDVVSASGAFCGGAIAPGPDLLLAAMHQGTEKLPRVAFEKPAFALGADTEEAMRSGAFWGAVGLVERLIRQVRGELLGRARVLATGGAMPLLAPHVAAVDALVPELTLEGLALLHLPH